MARGKRQFVAPRHLEVMSFSVARCACLNDKFFLTLAKSMQAPRPKYLVTTHVTGLSPARTPAERRQSA